MTITLRKVKQKKSNKISLYLDIYKGTTLDKNGNKKIIREYKFLNLYLVDNPKTDSDKLHNKQILQLAKNIKNQKELELQTDNYGFSKKNNSKDTNFFEYFCNLTEIRKNTSCYKLWKCTQNELLTFSNENVTFAEITEDFCKKFINYLENKPSRSGGKLKNGYINDHYHRLSMALKQAVEDKIISENPLQKIKLLKEKKAEKVYLTLEELRCLAKTECRYKELKRAFLFSCLTGLRWSDIYKLQWGEIKENGGKYSIEYRQKKTQELNYLPLSEQSVSYLGKRGDSKSKVFNFGISNNLTTEKLRKWCLLAGITKHITYHSSRHTFAVLQLSMGTPIFTVQKLLGHTDIKSTMGYANIVDTEKEKAMNRIPNIL